jgi:hypothetical protein
MHEQSKITDLLLRVEQVKYRKTGPGKSPLGTFYIFDDHIEWKSDSDPTDQMTVHLSKIKGLPCFKFLVFIF